ncbi:MAG: transcription antitermination factor NusB [Clostridia bacterium]|nr:transcription antitermination factor NusB [Clostridia bacterium]
MEKNPKENKKISRREERQTALGFVFERMFRDDTAEDVFADAENARDTIAGDYVKTVVQGVEQHLEEIDRVIEANLKGWKKNRISKISLTILRIAVFEMLYIKDIPIGVSINEAVELAKNYATDNDGSFVNGVLGSIAKSLETSGDQ